jgi:predicted nucleic acid-binding protein
MTNAVDTNVLLDVFLPDPDHGRSSLERIESAYAQGALVICTIVYAELVPQFAERSLLDQTLVGMGIQVMEISRDSAFLAGIAWKEYTRRGGRRDRIITDFLIGAFAEVHADQFLTRDRGFYRQYFKNLKQF